MRTDRQMHTHAQVLHKDLCSELQITSARNWDIYK